MTIRYKSQCLPSKGVETTSFFNSTSNMIKSVQHNFTLIKLVSPLCHADSVLQIAWNIKMMIKKDFVIAKEEIKKCSQCFKIEGVERDNEGARWRWKEVVKFHLALYCQPRTSCLGYHWEQLL